MNELRKKKIRKHADKLVGYLIEENQDLIEDMAYDDTEEDKEKTLHILFKEMAWDSLYDDETDGAPLLNDEDANEWEHAILEAILNNANKISNMINAIRK